MVNEKRSPRRILALLLCTCIARSWVRSAVATIQSLNNFGGIRTTVDNIQNGFGIREKWPLSGSPFPFFSAPEPNVAILAIPLFRTEVGRSVDERRWQNAQRKSLNSAKNTEQCQEYGTRILGLSSIIGANLSEPLPLRVVRWLCLFLSYVRLGHGGSFGVIY